MTQVNGSNEWLKKVIDSAQEVGETVRDAIPTWLRSTERDSVEPARETAPPDAARVDGRNDLSEQARLQLLQAHLQGPAGAARPAAPVPAVPADVGAAVSEAVALYEAGELSTVVKYLNNAQKENPQAFGEAVDMIAGMAFQPPTMQNGQWRADPKVDSFLRWVQRNGSVETQAWVSARLFEAVDAERSAQFEPYMKNVIQMVSEPRVLDRWEEGRMRDLMVAGHHFVHNEPNRMRRVVVASAEYHAKEMAAAVHRGDWNGAEDHAHALGKLLKAGRDGIEKMNAPGKEKAYEEIFAWYIKGLSLGASAMMPAPAKAAYGLGSEIVKEYVKSANPKGPRSFDEMKHQVKAVFEEIAWNQIDPDGKLHHYENGALVVHEWQDGFKDVERRIDRLWQETEESLAIGE